MFHKHQLFRKNLGCDDLLILNGQSFESLMDAIASPFQLEGTDQQLINSKRFCGLFHPLSMYLLIIVFELKRCPIGPCVCHTTDISHSKMFYLGSLIIVITIGAFIGKFCKNCAIWSTDVYESSFPFFFSLEIGEFQINLF